MSGRVQELLDKFNKIDTKSIINLTTLLYDPNINLTLEEIRDCLSHGQLLSKFWLIDELNNLNLDKEIGILILGGWIGSLANFIFQYYKNQEQLKGIISLDIDPKYERIADLFNIDNFTKGWRFKAATGDMYDIDYHNTKAAVKHGTTSSNANFKWDVLINTSCEHIQDTKAWFDLLPKDKIIVVQSNNYFACDQHVNCVNSLEEFEKQFEFKEILYKGSLPLQVYDRYMIIGIK